MLKSPCFLPDFCSAAPAAARAEVGGLAGWGPPLWAVLKNSIYLKTTLFPVLSIYLSHLSIYLSIVLSWRPSRFIPIHQHNAVHVPSRGSGPSRRGCKPLPLYSRLLRHKRAAPARRYSGRRAAAVRAGAQWPLAARATRGRRLARRKFDALSLPALDTLSILIDHTIAEQHRRLSPRQVCGMSQAVRVFPEDTASEVAHAHACESVVSTTAAKRASFEASHLLRLGLEHTQIRGPTNLVRE
jgi:hypothetical protein